MNWGVFINTVINFLIVAFAVFIVVKGLNAAKRKQETEEEEAPAAPAEDVVLLREIRDALQRR